MYKSIKDAKKNMEKIMKEEKNDEIINSHESIIEAYEEFWHIINFDLRKQLFFNIIFYYKSDNSIL